MFRFSFASLSIFLILSLSSSCLFYFFHFSSTLILRPPARVGRGGFESLQLYHCHPFVSLYTYSFVSHCLWGEVNGLCRRGRGKRRCFLRFRCILTSYPLKALMHVVPKEVLTFKTWNFFKWHLWCPSTNSPTSFGNAIKIKQMPVKSEAFNLRYAECSWFSKMLRYFATTENWSSKFGLKKVCCLFLPVWFMWF